MPPLAVLEDGQIAAIASYLRSGLESNSARVSRDLVKRERERSSDRTQPWKAAELTASP